MRNEFGYVLCPRNTGDKGAELVGSSCCSCMRARQTSKLSACVRKVNLSQAFVALRMADWCNLAELRPREKCLMRLPASLGSSLADMFGTRVVDLVPVPKAADKQGTMRVHVFVSSGSGLSYHGVALGFVLVTSPSAHPARPLVNALDISHTLLGHGNLPQSYASPMSLQSKSGLSKRLFLFGNSQ